MPGAVELGDAFAGADGAVSGGVVQGDAGPVFGEDRGLEGPQSCVVGGSDLLVQQVVIFALVGH